MNSIYDTWAGTGGHQPYGHDTLATMYNRYKVLGCRVQLVFTTPGAANDMICVMAPSSNTSSGMTGLQLYAVQEWPQSVCGILPSSGERRCVLQATYDMATIAGVSKASYLAEEDYSAAIGSSPSKSIYLTFNSGAVDGSGSETCKSTSTWSSTASSTTERRWVFRKAGLTLISVLATFSWYRAPRTTPQSQTTN